MWKENCTKQYYNYSYPPHSTGTLSLRGHNSSLDRYSEHVTQTATIPNYAPVAIARCVHRHNNVGSTYPCKAIFNASASYDPDGSITNYQWDFGDGTSETNALVEHIYSSWNWNGTGYDPFIVSLTVTDDLDSSIDDTISMPVNVYIVGDANGDGEVDIFDATVVGLEWDKACESGGWIDRSDRADLNNDCVIDIFDAVIIGANWEHIAY